MSWLESKHRRSEEKALELQNVEYGKILETKRQVWLQVNKFEQGLGVDDFLDDKVIEVPYLFLTDETRHTDYNTDTYKLAGSKRIKGRIYNAMCLSHEFISKYHLNYSVKDKIVRIGGERWWDRNKINRIIKNLSGHDRFYAMDYNDIRLLGDNGVHLPIKKRTNLEQWEIIKCTELGLKDNQSKTLPVVGIHDNGEVVRLHMMHPVEYDVAPDLTINLDQ